MNTRKNYNSIVFLTVYLGLVLVGATPQVLAQAATPRLFDIKTEIEFKDDLDNKPDDEVQNLLKTLEKDYFTIDKYFGEIEDFLVDLEKLNSIEKFDLEDDFQAVATRSMPCFVNGDPVGIGTEKFNVNHNRWLTPALTDAIYDLQNYTSFLEDCLSSRRFEEAKERNSTVKLFYNSSELKIEISGQKESSQKALQLATNLNKVFAVKFGKITNKPVIKQLYENTKAVSENNQVFIITRLPRASIDEFLAVKNAR